MKSIKYLFVLACMTFVSVSLFAQEKTLMTEYDGFQWYYLKQGDKCGAQSIGGVTFIPLSRGYTRINYWFTDGGYFVVDKGDEKNGLCDKTGREIIAPGRYDGVSYNNEDGLEYCTVKLNGKYGVCDRNGREIIAPRYDFVFGDHDYNNKKVNKYYRTLNGKIGPYGDIKDKKEGACDINGREIIVPMYEDLACFDGVFKYKNASGKWISTGIKLDGNTQYTNIGGSTSSYSSTTKTSSSSNTPTSSNSESGLLYKGEYTLRLSQSKELNSGYSVGEYSSDETETISIYEDHIKINNVTCNYESTNSNGERVYKGSSLGTTTVYVSPTYEIRYYNESFLNGRGMRVTFPVVKGRSCMSNDNGGGNNAGTYTSPTQPSQLKIEKEQRQPKKAHSSYKTCHICHGDGVCPTCNGKGWYNNPYGTGTVICRSCNNGKCSTCNGTGKVLGPIEYY